VYYDRSNTCFANLTVEQIDWDYLLDPRLVHLSGLTVPLSPSVREITIEAARRAQARGIAVSFDLNYRQRMWTTAEARLITVPAQRHERVRVAAAGLGRVGFPRHPLAPMIWA
jgi:2-dehydro-3-deoxygluconokinase